MKSLYYIKSVLFEESNQENAISTIVDSYINKTLEDIQNILYSIDCKEAISLYEDLPVQHRARLLLSAECSSLIAMKNNFGEAIKHDDIGQYIIDIFKREYLVSRIPKINFHCNFIHYQNDIRWSPYGDIGFFELDHEISYVEQHKLYFGATLDAVSDLSYKGKLVGGALAETSLQFSGEEIFLIKNKINEAVKIIQHNAPGYFYMVCAFLNRIIIRKSVTRAEALGASDSVVVGSDHWEGHYGTIKLLNPHLEEMSVIDCADRILHETLHCFIATIEKLYGYFVKKSLQTRAYSFWSGNHIPDSSMSHAILIYFAEYRFMRAILQNRYSDINIRESEVEEKMRHNAVGFKIARRAQAHFSPAANITAEFSNFIEEISNVVKTGLRTAQ